MEKIQVIKVSDILGHLTECEKLQSKHWAVQSFGISKVKAEGCFKHVGGYHEAHHDCT